MSSSEQISDLLLRWEELRDEGRALPVQELCQDCPELADVVARRIEALEAVYRVPNGISTQPEASEDKNGRPLIQPGQVQIPGYKILEILGHGGMGVVYRASHLSLKREVALKMILTGPHASPRDVQRLRAEAEMVARLQHPNIIQIYEVGDWEGRPYLALELVQGGSLADKLDGRPLPAHEAAELVEKLARAMHYAHKLGIIHRDLKPANVLLSGEWRLASGEKTLHSALANPKISDFGLAKRLDHAAGQTQSGAIMGTPSYMSPEQAAGRTDAIGTATDIYALGAILYELLTGRPPFQAASPLQTIMQISAENPPAPRVLNPRLERDLETICLKCLEKEPQHRYASAAELAEDLHRYRSGELIHARSITLVDRLTRTLNGDEQIPLFHAMGILMRRLTLVPFLTHLLAFALWHRETYYPVAAVLTTTATVLVLLVFAVRTAWRRGLFSSAMASRHFWSIRIGHFLGMLIIPLLCMQLSTPQTPLSLLTVYPFWAAITAVTFFPLGSNLWGRLYLFGLVFFAAAPVMALQLELAPVELGFLVTLVLLVIGSHLRKIDRERQQLDVLSNYDRGK